MVAFGEDQVVLLRLHGRVGIRMSAARPGLVSADWFGPRLCRLPPGNGTRNALMAVEPSP